MKNEVIISDLGAAVTEKERLSDICCADRWEVVPYETADISGSLLVASEETWPCPVTVEPRLEGWYKIYVCMTSIGDKQHIELKLSGDDFGKNMNTASLIPYMRWNPAEQAEETFWKAANMTGQVITVSKKRAGLPFTSNLMWLRFVPMTDSEAAEYKDRCENRANKNMYAHYDTDYHRYDDFVNTGEYCKPIFAFKDSDVGVISEEVMTDFVDFSTVDVENTVLRNAFNTKRLKYFKFHNEHREEIYGQQIPYAHSLGIKLFAAHRMAYSNFCFPFSGSYHHISEMEEMREFRCKGRDGSECEFLSYAYREVQDFAISRLLDSAGYGFDGVTLIFTRGEHILFEEPVAKRFKEKYGDDADFYRLPETDSRIIAIRSDIMTEFMTRLRNALDGLAREKGTKPAEVYITSYFTVEESLRSGLDVERFAAEGLINGVVQSNMTVWEDIDGTLDSDELINLEKYTAKAETEYIIKRSHGNETDRTAAGAAAYSRIAEKYGIKHYSEIQWENTVAPESYVKAAKNILSKSSGSIALWDSYPHRVCTNAEWNAVSRLGNRDVVAAMSEDSSAYRRVLKVLSYGGKNMRLYHPSWRG